MVHRNAMKPRGQTSAAWTPLLRVRPKPEKHFLRHIFGHSAVTKHATSKSNDPSEIAVNQLVTGRMVSGLDSEHQRLIEFVDHCLAIGHLPKGT